MTRKRIALLYLALRSVQEEVVAHSKTAATLAFIDSLLVFF